MRFFARPALLVATALMLLAAMPARSAPCPSQLQLPSQPDPIPRDDADICGSRGLDTFAHMAWQTFRYLVWPAASRGVADGAARIDDRSRPRVFETYKADWEMFPSPAVATWEEYPSQAKFCKYPEAGRPAPLALESLILGSLDKFDSVTQPGGERIGNVLMAQNGSLVRYLAAFNETAFHHITSLAPSISFGPSEADPIEARAADGSLTIKSAWIEVRNSIPDRNRFHVRSAWVQDPFGICRETEVALVGLHIAHKTEANQQWVWASFEHVDNVPRAGPVPPDGFTFNDRRPVPMPFAPPLDARLDSRSGPPSLAAPFNVERRHPILSGIRDVNRIWQDALQGTVWSNYELVVVQWPTNSGLKVPPTSLFRTGKTLQPAHPAPPCDVLQGNTANTVMETFLQSAPESSLQDALTCPGAEKNVANTCMGCHYQAHNYDFIWAIPLNRRAASPAADKEKRDSAISILRGIVGRNAR